MPLSVVLNGRADVRRAIRILLIGAAVAAALGGIFAVPRVLPAVPGFEVRRVELQGIEWLSPLEVLQASGIREGQSVWDDPAQWEAALERHAVIAHATVSRRLPGTLRVEVEEKAPVAYLADEVLVPVSASGERLPLDPTRIAADLPIVRGYENGEVPPSMLAEVERLTRLAPVLLAEVSEIGARDPEGSELLLRHRAADIVVPAGAQADRLVELSAVLADLEERLRGKEVGGIATVDLRFEDQIVVRLPRIEQKP